MRMHAHTHAHTLSLSLSLSLCVSLSLSLAVWLSLCLCLCLCLSLSLSLSLSYEVCNVSKASIYIYSIYFAAFPPGNNTICPDKIRCDLTEFLRYSYVNITSQYLACEMEDKHG